MRHTHFRIQNYKGIKEVYLDLTAQPRANVFTLIGLNESGKTTILEAINYFSYRQELDPLNLPEFSTKDVHQLIPIGRRSNFNDTIAIEVGFELDAVDEEAISHFSKEKHNFNIAEPIGRFTISQKYDFKNSSLVPGEPEHNWEITIVGTRGKERVPRHLEDEGEWDSITDAVAARLPSVLYFPNFLFEIPDQIYLEDAPVDAPKHAYYRKVLQDVLDAAGDGTNINDHILARAKGATDHEKKSLESVLLKMGAHITKTVFTSWGAIFKRKQIHKSIEVTIAQDAQGRWFLQLRLKDGSDLYSISERSLGFRWFFAFLLLTQYRGARSIGPRDALFLFDEPASNLHPSAQNQLLTSFGRFPSQTPIVYTTHSHHMVNPEWLEGTFVVKNEGLDESGNDDNYTASQTDITLHKYRTFAAKYPNQSTYFQPVLDVLEYAPSKLENVPYVVMAEGKNDFYVLKYLQFLMRMNAPEYILPGGGAGSLTTPIQLYAAWGRAFVVLLDGDFEGEKQKERYETKFGSIVEGKIISLADIDKSWTGCAIERLFEHTDLIAVQTAADPSEKGFSKKVFHRSIEELLATRKVVTLSDNTLQRFERIFVELRRILGVG